VPAPTRPAAAEPRPRRRAAIATAAFLACALPTVFTVNITRMLLVGENPEHRFHQVTGQGLILFVLWLLPLTGLLRAGWRGERPSTALGWQHLVFVVTGVLCSVIAPGGGAPFLTAVVALTGALVWAALPKRPLLRARVQLHPALAPAALLGAAVLLPYSVDQLAAQNAVAGGHHAINPHLFDMAWLALCLVVLAIAAALLPVARHLMVWFAVATSALGVAGLAFGEDRTLSLTVLGVGVLAGAAWLSTSRAGSSRSAS
jgi:hypothetical protein